MKSLILSSRNIKEILRDPITSVLGIIMPVAMLILFVSINNSPNMPEVAMFKVANLAPGIIVFGFSFIIMFSGMLLAKDKKSAFLTRLFSSPLKASDYIIGYMLPFLPITMLQAVICYAVALILGLPITISILYSFAILIPAAIFSISAGMILGSLLNDNQVAGFGSVFITATQLFSGAWMDLKMVGGVFEKIGYILPFAHINDATRAILSGNYTGIAQHIYWIIGYMIATFVLAILSFKHAMKR